MNNTSFNPTPYLKKLGKGDYLEVKWRLLWLRTEHPEAQLETELVRLDDGFALFKANVGLPDGACATGYGSETQGDFGDFIEKAETKAIGRALAALGYGTQFCEDHDMTNPDGTPHVVDAPVEFNSSSNGNGYHKGAAQVTDISSGGSSLATPAQLKLMYLTGTRDLHITEAEVEERCQEKYGRLPLHLTKREASEFIDSLRSVAGRNGR